MTEKEAMIDLIEIQGKLQRLGMTVHTMHQESLNIAIEALKKQMEKKPICIEDKMWTCPCCYNNLMFKYSRYPDILMPKEAGENYCMSCGQKIDWTVIDLLDGGE